MRKLIVVMLMLLFIVTACNNKKVEEVNFLDPIEVQLTTETELSVNEEIVTQALITQKEVPISDVEEVVFEIWQHGNPDSYRYVEGTLVGNGVYEVTWKANEDGVYYIFYHVTAKGMHRMEKHQFVFGDVDVEKILATPDERPKKHMH